MAVLLRDRNAVDRLKALNLILGIESVCLIIQSFWKMVWSISHRNSKKHKLKFLITIFIKKGL